MATKKSNIYIDSELDWAEQKLLEWKEYIDEHPIKGMTDRMDYKETARGGMVRTVIASIEAQAKFQKELLHEYFVLLPQVKALRQAQDAAKEKEAKGNANVPARMRGQTQE